MMKNKIDFKNIFRLATSTAGIRSERKSGLKRIGLILAVALFPVGSASADIFTTANIGGVDVEIRRGDNSANPLIIFSHGMGSCPGSTNGIQSRLADAGYIIVAPKHVDCATGSTTPDVPWGDPEDWNDQSNSNRRDDIHAVLDALPTSSFAQYVDDFNSIGCMGHSMGGYTCMGVAGAWSSWNRTEIDAVAALSPWHKPFMVQDQVAYMTNVDTLYQGGTLDNPITADLTKAGGTYDQTLPSKCMQVFNRAGHSAWTDGALSSRFHNEMGYYLISFFDASLKNGNPADLLVKKSRVKTLECEL